jgi:hypothetical protein
MGCWNKTCGLSNLHITSGDDVYVFVIEENTNKTERCYSTAFWAPLLLPFTSKYNDYGGGEESGGAGFQLIMDGVAKQLVEMDLGENQYHDIAVKKEGFGEEQFFEAVHEGRLFRTGRSYGSFQPVNVIIDFVMMRKDVVDYILENRVIEEYVGDGKGTTGWGNNYINYKFEDILKDIPEFIDKLSTMANPLAGDDTDFELKEALMELRFMRGLGIFDYKHPNKVSKWLRGDSYRYSSIVSEQDAVMSLLKDGKSAEAESLVTDLLKGHYIDAFMEATRKNWAPGGHEGSQSQEADEYRLLMKAMTSALDADDAYWKEVNGEDESED